MTRTIEAHRTNMQAEVWGDFCFIYALPERMMLANERVRRVCYGGKSHEFRIYHDGLAVRLPDGVNPDTVQVELTGGAA